METKDAVKVSPKYYKVVFENERVRVLENRMKPREKTGMHSHPACVAIVLRGGKFGFTTPTGESQQASLKTGEVAWFDPVSHTTENIGKTDVHSIIVELK